MQWEGSWRGRVRSDGEAGVLCERDSFGWGEIWVRRDVRRGGCSAGGSVLGWDLMCGSVLLCAAAEGGELREEG